MILLLLRLVLLRRLVHRVQDAEVVLGVLEIAFRHHSITRGCRIPPELQILLEQLLRRAAHPQVRAVAVEHMVAVERNSATAAAAVMTDRTAPAIPVTAPAHTLHVVHRDIMCLP